MKSISLMTFLAGAAFIAMAGTASAAGDAAAGEKVFAKCKACHQIGEGAKNAIAPELNGIDGRKASSVEGYNYSDAMKASGITWDAASFKEFIKNPKAKVPGTKMVFQGLPSEGDEDNVWAYISSYGADGKKK
ncbi:c-type cytochrome [Methylocystis heyeri]|jgi:cytochrome c|uniref:C-type cytochrome n=1 Tax=Methylocystis heyeri TaxID=391905 RepID=A0A6B8KDW2_9HYPH|nr:cytochrome c family protein [Methylocystis heyeri]QGM45201.1 c-type cytochrome [Methylocystis heyeri]